MSSSAATQSEAKRPGDVRPVVFVVDDDISVRESLASLIAFAGWRTETFESARQFLARPQELAASCLVLDVHLPDLSGMDLQQRIKDDRNYMPIIFITGDGDVPTTVQAMKAGAVEFLTKPICDELDISEITVKAHRGSAMRKMKARSLPDLVNMAAKLSIVAPPPSRLRAGRVGPGTE